MVLAAVLFASARPARGVRDAEAVALGVRGEEALEEGGLAGAGGAGDDDGAVGFWERERGVSGGVFVGLGWVVWRGFGGGGIYLPVEDIVARWRKEMGGVRRMEEGE